MSELKIWSTNSNMIDKISENRVYITDNPGSQTLAGDLTITDGIIDMSYGSSNVVIGGNTFDNTNALRNVAVGYEILSSMTGTCNGNVGLGYQCLKDLTTGNDNISMGRESMEYAISGSANIAIGTRSYQNIDTDSYNVGVGYETGRNFVGSSNVCIGYRAGGAAGATYDKSSNVIIGNRAGEYYATHNNIIIGSQTLHGAVPTTDANVAIGYRSEQYITDTNALSICCGSGPTQVFTYDNTILQIKPNSVCEGNLTVDGNLLGTGTYAEISLADGSTAQSIPTGVTYTKLTGFTTDGLNNNCTSDVSNDKITITTAGVYKIIGSFNFQSGTAGVTWRGCAFLDGSEQDNVHFKRKTAGANDSGSASFVGLITVATVPLDLDVRIRQDNVGAVNFIPEYMTLVAHKV